MKFFSIEIPKEEVGFSSFLEEGINNYNNSIYNNLKITICKNEVSKSIFLELEIDNSDINKEYLDGVIANILSEGLFKEYYKNTVNKVLKSQYNYLESDDTITVKSKMDSLMLSGYSIEKGLIREKISNSIKDYISENNEIKIKGFVTFRLKEYMNYIQDEIERIVDEVFMEREYNEFIKLLRYFVEIQEPKFEEINILCDENVQYMRYKLYDQNFKPIDSKELLDLDADMNEVNINSDDLLISWLITAAPAKIVIHNIRKFNSKTIETINNVFINKVSICDGCSHCVEKIEKFSLTKLKENFNRNLDNIYK